MRIFLRHITFINDVSDVLHLSSGCNSGLQNFWLKKHMYYQCTIRELNNYNIVTKNIDKLNNHLSRGPED